MWLLHHCGLLTIQPRCIHSRIYQGIDNFGVLVIPSLLGTPGLWDMHICPSDEDDGTSQVTCTRLPGEVVRTVTQHGMKKEFTGHVAGLGRGN